MKCHFLSQGDLVSSCSCFVYMAGRRPHIDGNYYMTLTNNPRVWVSAQLREHQSPPMKHLHVQ